jgi:hypothetical protein
MDLTAIAVSLTTRILSLLDHVAPAAPAGSGDILTVDRRDTTWCRCVTASPWRPTCGAWLKLVHAQRHETLGE